jgi:pyrimidine 5'-nucleotidase
MFFETILFDLDDTLYPASSGLWTVLQSRIELFMTEKMHLATDQVPALREELFRKHGTTLRGLSELYHIDEQEFLDFVHNVPLADYIQPNPRLKAVLSQMPQRKIIFTNADSNHATRVINVLELHGCFEQIIDVRDIHPYCKPQKEAFQKALELAAILQPQKCLMIDDAPRNLIAAKTLGISTVLIGNHSSPETFDHCINCIDQIENVLQEF